MARTSRTKIAIISIAIILISASAVGSFVYLGSQEKKAQPESIRVGLMSLEVEGLINVASDRGYFNDNGLNVTFVDYPSGLATVNGLLKGEVEIATATEFVLVGKAMANMSVVSIGNIDKFTIGDLMVRTDRGITNASDLVGKRIGIPLGTVGEYNLARFLESNGIETGNVTLVNNPPRMLPEALMNGSVDAAWTTKAWFEMTIGPIPENILDWTAQNDRFTNYLAIADHAWALNHPETVKKFLRALDHAEQFTIQDPPAAKKMVQLALNDTEAYMQQVWPDNQFSISLDQTLVLTMEDESRWMIRSNLTTSPVPNFLNFLYLDGLEAVDPGSVNIIR